MLVFKQRPAGFHHKAFLRENIRILSENAPDTNGGQFRE